MSWRFLELGKLPAVVITSPADERLMADDAELDSRGSPNLRVRAKAWSARRTTKVEATFADVTVPLKLIQGSEVWGVSFKNPQVPPGVHPLRVVATDVQGNLAEDLIRVLIGTDKPARQRAKRDQDNALEAWSEHGLLGTQLGPNKNGRKW